MQGVATESLWHPFTSLSDSYYTVLIVIDTQNISRQYVDSCVPHFSEHFLFLRALLIAQSTFYCKITGYSITCRHDVKALLLRTNVKCFRADSEKWLFYERRCEWFRNRIGKAWLDSADCLDSKTRVCGTFLWCKRGETSLYEKLNRSSGLGPSNKFQGIEENDDAIVLT